MLILAMSSALKILLKQRNSYSHIIHFYTVYKTYSKLSVWYSVMWNQVKLDEAKSPSLKTYRIGGHRVKVWSLTE